MYQLNRARWFRRYIDTGAKPNTSERKSSTLNPSFLASFDKPTPSERRSDNTDCINGDTSRDIPSGSPDRYPRFVNSIINDRYCQSDNSPS